MGRSAERAVPKIDPNSKEMKKNWHAKMYKKNYLLYFFFPPQFVFSKTENVYMNFLRCNLFLQSENLNEKHFCNQIKLHICI